VGNFVGKFRGPDNTEALGNAQRLNQRVIVVPAC
jgi:hypothetical protein